MAGNLPRILLVEDHDDTRYVTARMLAQAGFVVIPCADSAAALQHELSTYDIALIDIGLPNVAGDQLLGQLLQRGPVNAIALTAWCAEKDMQRYLAAGFLKCLRKPVTFNELIEVLSELGSRPTQPLSSDILAENH